MEILSPGHLLPLLIIAVFVVVPLVLLARLAVKGIARRRGGR